MYLPLARKYRPQTFGDVVGQEHVTRTIQNAILLDRVHHAYLFCGARGVGKTTVARLVAKALNCAQRETRSDGEASPGMAGAAVRQGRTESIEPCNQCTSCVEIAEARSLDVHEIDGASHTGVDNVREIRELLQYQAVGARYKIYIIDEVHMLSTAAFNALLKTLEEPPPHVLFIFATTEPQKIPVTILSRCQRYDFRRVDHTRLIETLHGIAQREGYQVDTDVLRVIAVEAEGSLRDAESLLDQAVAFGGPQVGVDALRQLLGFTDRASVRALITALTARDATATLGHLETIYQAGGNLVRLGQELLELVRHLWVLASCGQLPNPDAVPQEEIAFLQGLAAQHDITAWQQWFALLYRGVDDVARSRLPKLAMEAMLLQCVQVEVLTPIAELLARVEALQGGGHVATGAIAATVASNASAGTTSSAPRATHREPKTAPMSTAATAPATSPSMPSAPGTMPQRWERCLALLQQQRPPLASLLAHGEVRFPTPTTLEVAFPKDSPHAEMLKDPIRMEQLTTLARAHLHPECVISVTAAGGTSRAEAQQQERKEREARVRSATDAALQHDLVRDAHRILGAEVKEVKVLA